MKIAKDTFCFTDPELTAKQLITSTKSNLWTNLFVVYCVTRHLKAESSTKTSHKKFCAGLRIRKLCDQKFKKILWKLCKESYMRQMPCQI